RARRRGRADRLHRLRGRATRVSARWRRSAPRARAARVRSAAASGAPCSPVQSTRRGCLMRLFVALAPPAGVLDDLDAACAPLRLGREDLRWTSRELWHVTLAFLGEVSEERLDRLVPRLERAARRHLVFGLSPAGAGGGPQPGRGRGRGE